MQNCFCHVENECTSHNFSLFAIILPKIIKIGENLTKFWQKQFCTVFLRHGVIGLLCEIAIITKWLTEYHITRQYVQCAYATEYKWYTLWLLSVVWKWKNDIIVIIIIILMSRHEWRQRSWICKVLDLVVWTSAVLESAAVRVYTTAFTAEMTRKVAIIAIYCHLRPPDAIAFPT